MVLVRVTILQGRRSAQQNLTTGIIGNIFAEPWYDISCADPGWEPVAAVQIRALTVNPKIHPPLALHCENTTPTGIGCTRIDRDLPGCETPHRTPTENGKFVRMGKCHDREPN